jgi:hypothetical protein
VVSKKRCTLRRSTTVASVASDGRIADPEGSMDADRAREDFENFTHSVTAVRLLLGRAYESGNVVEGLVLYASLVDALLRMLVAHATGKREGTLTHLDLRYFIHDETLWMNERKVYRAARDCGVLSLPEFRELEELYDFRNMVIHRFIISGITYDQIGPRLDQYEVIYERLVARLEVIEQPSPLFSAEALTAVRSRIARKLGEHDPHDQGSP